MKFNNCKKLVSILFIVLPTLVYSQEVSVNQIVVKKYEVLEKTVIVTVVDAMHYNSLKDWTPEQINSKYLQVEGIKSFKINPKYPNQIEATFDKSNFKNLGQMYLNIPKNEMDKINLNK